MCGPGLEMLMLMHDECHSCGVETEFTADMNAGERKYYVASSDEQYCKKCYNKRSNK